jgi:peroxiredoxin
MLSNVIIGKSQFPWELHPEYWYGAVIFIEGVHKCVLTSFRGRLSPTISCPITRALSGSSQGDDPLILTLARGHYCPKEHQQHLELASFYPKIAVAYTQIATISTDDHHTLQEFRASVGAQWPFLSDPERVVQKDLDIQEYTDPENNPMIPHTLVLKPGLVIHSIYNGYWFWGRPSLTDLWHDLRSVGLTGI